MSTYLLDRALLPSGWADSVRLRVGDGGRIEAVEAGDDHPDAEPPGERIRGIVVPGVPNLHSHAFQRAMAGLAERGSGAGDSFWGWRQVMYRFLRELGPEEIEAVAAQLYVEMLRAGYTSVAEFHYLHRDPDGQPYAAPAETSLRLLAAADAAGIGLTLLPCLYTSGGFGGVPLEGEQRRFRLSVEELLGLVEELRGEVTGDADPGGNSPGHSSRAFRVGLALHSLRAVTPGELAAAVEGVRARDPAAPVHVHAAEQPAEVEACLEWSGARPVEWLLDRAPVDRRWCLVHATHVDDREIDRLADSGAVAGLCPTTEANLGDGLFPLPRYLDRGGRLGIGSDSHVTVSPSEELRWLEYGQRLALGRRAVAARGGGGDDAPSTGRRLLDAALAGGGAALGQPAGRLEPGARADWIVLDPDHPVLAGRTGDGALDAWIVSGDRSPVRDVMVAGEWRVRDGLHPGEERIAARYRAVARRLAAAL